MGNSYFYRSYMEKTGSSAFVFLKRGPVFEPLVAIP